MSEKSRWQVEYDALPKENPELTELLRAAVARVKAMTPEESAAMHRAQAENWVRAEMSWPAPRYEWVNGVKVYASYEDYCNG